MKKLMIAAVAAAMIGGAQAVTCVSEKVCEKDPCTGEKTCEEVVAAGTAHKVVISLKTTVTKSKAKSAKACEDPECTYWRQQGTKKINGLLWEKLEDCYGCVPFGINCAFWTKDQALDGVEFAMGAGIIGKGENSKKAEAYGGLYGDEFGALSWAAFGTWAASSKKNECAEDDCVMYVKSLSGSIAGYLIPDGWTDECLDCCDQIEYAGCCDDMQLANTAAYGTIKISYDTATAKKVALAEDADDLASFFKVPAAVAEDIVVGEVVIEE